MSLQHAIAYALTLDEPARPTPPVQAVTIPAAVPAPTGNGPAAPLTARERDVASLIAQGLTNRQIAAALVITPGTARTHVEHIMTKLGLHARAQVATWAATHGMASASAAATP